MRICFAFIRSNYYGMKNIMASNQKLYIRKNSKIHSSGLFAKTDITEGARIIEYRGLKVTKAQSDKIADVHIDANKKKGTIGAVYIFTLNDRYDINGKVSWNLAKLYQPLL